ncbi:hypothetical protein ABK040_009819 [Willaertia magna]
MEEINVFKQSEPSFSLLHYLSSGNNKIISRNDLEDSEVPLFHPSQIHSLSLNNIEEDNNNNKDSLLDMHFEDYDGYSYRADDIASIQETVIEEEEFHKLTMEDEAELNSHNKPFLKEKVEEQKEEEYFDEDDETYDTRSIYSNFSTLSSPRQPVIPTPQKAMSRDFNSLRQVLDNSDIIVEEELLSEMGSPVPFSPPYLSPMKKPHVTRHVGNVELPKSLCKKKDIGEDDLKELESNNEEMLPPQPRKPSNRLLNANNNIKEIQTTKEERQPIVIKESAVNKQLTNQNEEELTNPNNRKVIRQSSNVTTTKLPSTKSNNKSNKFGDTERFKSIFSGKNQQQDQNMISPLTELPSPILPFSEFQIVTKENCVNNENNNNLPSTTKNSSRLLERKIKKLEQEAFNEQAAREMVLEDQSNIVHFSSANNESAKILNHSIKQQIFKNLPKIQESNTAIEEKIERKVKKQVSKKYLERLKERPNIMDFYNKNDWEKEVTLHTNGGRTMYHIKIENRQPKMYSSTENNYIRKFLKDNPIL